MGRRPEPPGRMTLQINPLEVAIERQVEVQPRLLAVRDNVQPRRHLVVHRGDDRIVLRLDNVVRPELVEVPTGEFQPARKRVTADDGGAERAIFHGSIVSLISRRAWVLLGTRLHPADVAGARQRPRH
jgi:hypothetical protein